MQFLLQHVYIEVDVVTFIQENQISHFHDISSLLKRLELVTFIQTIELVITFIQKESNALLFTSFNHFLFYLNYDSYLYILFILFAF